MNVKVYSFFTVLLLIIGGSVSSFGQCLEDSLNMIKLYEYEDPSQPGNYNDVWGYVAPDGSEYGIIGAGDSILMFNVSDPENITKVGSMPGEVVCTWRDFKTYENYLYAVNDCSTEGLLIFDLSALPTAFPQVNQITADFTDTHNIYIDESSGRLYAVGSNTQPNGMIIYDIATDPLNPILLASVDLGDLPGESMAVNYYIHDIFVKNDTAYCSHGYTGYAIWDVTDVENIDRISNMLELNSGVDYVHSSWNIESDTVAYVATEIGANQMYIVKQKDFTEIELDSTWKEPLLESCGGPVNNVPHNPYVHDGLLYISYYQDGVQILDISDRKRIQRIAFYDTNPNNTTYNGTANNWGVYPFLPSGTIIASDTRFGFFALKYVPPAVPVVLHDFAVKLGTFKQSATISWSIASATNVLGFDVERSTDGVNFQSIKYVEFNRYSDEYSLIDSNLKDGTHYYRLKTTDYDGTFEYSELRKVYIASSASATINPTVNSGIFQLDLSENSRWNYTIYSAKGERVENGLFDGKTKDFDCSAYAAGMYYLIVNNEINQFQSSFILLE